MANAKQNGNGYKRLAQAVIELAFQDLADGIEKHNRYGRDHKTNPYWLVDDIQDFCSHSNWDWFDTLCKLAQFDSYMVRKQLREYIETKLANAN